jgi:hypothetical protein
MLGFGKKHEDVPTPHVENETPALADPEPSALEMTSSAHCRACHNGYGDGCCAYHQEQWNRLFEREEHLSKHHRERRS